MLQQLDGGPADEMRDRGYKEETRYGQAAGEKVDGAITLDDEHGRC